jgi:small conductance mechanosensitive channel
VRRPRGKANTPLAQRAQRLRAEAAERARNARRQLLVLTPLLVGTLAVYRFRLEIFGVDKPVAIATVAILVIVGWAFARGVGRALGPVLDRRLERGTAGVVAFVVRLVGLGAVIIPALRVAGLKPGTLAVGASVTVVILGLAGQQTIGNVIAGIVLLSAKPFSVGDRVEFEGFGIDVEGTVASLGLLYVTLTEGDDVVLIPNSVVLTRAVKPLRSARGVDLRVRLGPESTPSEVERALVEELTVPTREDPAVSLDEYDDGRVVVRVTVTPAYDEKGPTLADEVLAIVHRLDEAAGARGRGPQSVGVGSEDGSAPKLPETHGAPRSR